MEQNNLFINDNKFKSIFISVNFIRRLNRQENSKNALLASVLRKATKSLETEKEIDLELAKLYSSSVDINVEKIGGIYNMEFGAEFINKKYVEQDVSNNVINIVYDMIYNPYMENGTFSKEIFEREKKVLIEKLNQEKNDKRKWSLKRLEEEMYKETDYEMSVLGDASDILKITVEDLYEYYKEFIKTSEIRIVVAGNLDEYDNLEATIEKKFLNIDNKVKRLELINRDELKQVEEYERLNQSVLCFGLNVKNTDKDAVPAIAVYNSILGGTPASKLFQNVREKESLAYFAKSQYNKYINAIYIYSGINLTNVDKATNVINKQLEDLKKGNITEEELDTAKKSIILMYKSLADNKVTYARTLLANMIYYNDVFDIQKFIHQVQKVTLKDVVRVAQDIELNTKYLLGGKIDE